MIESVAPEVDCGRFAAKAIEGDDVVVEADAFADGHDMVRCVLLYRGPRRRKWREAAMEPIGNDRWRGSLTVSDLGRWRFTLEAWVDDFATWRSELAKRIEAGQELAVPLEIGARLVEAATRRAKGTDARRLRDWGYRIRDAGEDGAVDPFDPGLADLVARYPDRSRATRYRRELTIDVDRVRARFSAWYEFFPRSAGSKGSAASGGSVAAAGSAAGARGATLRDAVAMLDYIAEMGFDVVYLPPIHPIGRTKRKGRNNAIEAAPDDPGSTWAIGGEEGGHKAIHRELGTLADFQHFRREAEARGLEVALDIAFQCSPDHPYVKEHPEWFRHRPDGTVQFAENPPKKYEDIYPFDFETGAWRSLWDELLSVFLFWIDQGVKIFRVDNPHTKPFPFWEWAIGEIRRRHPDTILLSEAFTRPKVMYHLAKLGFTQSYTYFAWRNAKWELERYMREISSPQIVDFFRPSFWPNTPDILTEILQIGGRPAFMTRLVLAATLSPSYGIYGPAFELMEHLPREPGSEEYLGSEKYEIRRWDLDRADSLKHFVARVNRIRRENPALQRMGDLAFHRIDSEALIAYSKRVVGRTARDGAAGGDGGGGGEDNTILTFVNLDPYHVQAGVTDLDLAALGLAENEPFQVHDLLGGGRYRWSGRRNYVELNPGVVPAHVFRIERSVPARTERDFPYFM